MSFLKYFFGKEPEESEDEEVEVYIENIEDELLEEGEFDYENYDEVCCPECGAYLGKGVTACGECGFGQERDSTCSYCGKYLDEGDADIGFCPYCNHSFNKK